jgi:mitomycin resistance protein mcrB
MQPDKVRREAVRELTDLPNVGKATAADLHRLDIHQPQDLVGCDAYALYHELCRLDGVRHDPCVLDVLLSLVDFIQGGAAQPWWAFTAERKARWPGL